MSRNAEIAFFIIRIVLGVVFLAHGLQKVQGIENVVGNFGKMGLPVFMAYFVTGIEFLGGIAILVGLGTRLVSTLFILLMLGAILKVKLSAGFLGGYELDVALLTMATALLLSGSKLWSLDHLFFDRDHTKVST